MAQVSGSVTLCSNDAILEKFALLSSSFGRAVFSSTYDLWVYVDFFGTSKLYKSLQSSHRSVMIGAKKASTRSGTDDFVMDVSALKLPSDNKRRRLERKASQSAASSVVSESVPGTFNS